MSETISTKKPTTKKRTKTTGALDPRKLVLEAGAAAAEKKAVDIAVLELKKFSSFTDYILLCSGKSDRQVQSIAEYIGKRLSEKGIRPLNIEGMRDGRWILLDYTDVIVHVFYEPVRRFYDLESLWIEAPRTEIDAETGKPMPKKRKSRAKAE